MDEKPVVTLLLLVFFIASCGVDNSSSNGSLVSSEENIRVTYRRGVWK